MAEIHSRRPSDWRRLLAVAFDLIRQLRANVARMDAVNFEVQGLIHQAWGGCDVDCSKKRRIRPRFQWPVSNKECADWLV